MKRTNGVKKNSPTAMLEPRQTATSRKRSWSLHGEIAWPQESQFSQDFVENEFVWGVLRKFEEVFFVNEIQKLSRLYQLLYHVLSFYLSFRSDARIAISLVSFPNTNLGGKRQPCFASDYNLQLMDRKKTKKVSFGKFVFGCPLILYSVFVYAVNGWKSWNLSGFTTTES